MARTELPNGIILPAEYSDDWYDDMTSNLSKLDDVIGSDADKLSAENVGAAALSNDYTDLDNKPALKPVATSGDYDDLDNKPDLKPVATSGDYDDLDNKPDLKPVATSGDYDDLTDLPAYGITRFCSSAITDNSSVAFSNISSTDKIKMGDFLLDTVGKMYQISSVDTSNETVSVTTPLTQLAVDSSVMHLSGNETASGQKTFSGGATLNSWLYFTNTSVTKGTIPQTSVSPYRIYFGSGVSYGASLFNIDTSVSSTGVQTLTLRSAENVLSGDDTRLGIIYDPSLTQPRCVKFKGDCLPNSNNTYECGNNSLKWKSINGINPGALSLPDLNNGIDISGYITNFGAGTVNEYTPVSDGWISIASSGDSPIFIRVYNDYGFEQVVYSERNEIGGTTGGTYTRYGSIMIPCIKNIKIYIIVSPSTSVLVSAKFYPCLGNV